tara:strand:+ start:469 stop:1089 length:621 start_codon:yes stop_codon:yes gene_type:complete
MESWINKFEEYINRILRLDEQTFYDLNKYNDKIIAFEFINTKIKLYITLSENRLNIDSECNKDPDVLIKSSPTNFLKTILPSKYGMADFPVDMQVVGDITLAQDFQKIMRNLDIDLEDPLSKLVGDTLAYQIGQFMRKAGNITFKTVETLMVDISEYLRFEIEMLPDELLVEEFIKEVDLLRNDTELVSKRINKLDIYLVNNKYNN